MKIVKDENFLNVYIKYNLNGGVLKAFGKETLAGQKRRKNCEKALKLADEIAIILEENFNLEDLCVTDLENGKINIFAVSDNFQGVEKLIT